MTFKTLFIVWCGYFLFRYFQLDCSASLTLYILGYHFKLVATGGKSHGTIANGTSAQSALFFFNAVKPVLNGTWAQQKPVFSGNLYSSEDPNFKYLYETENFGPWRFGYRRDSLYFFEHIPPADAINRLTNFLPLIGTTAIKQRF
jgi:hypothetical protein